MLFWYLFQHQNKAFFRSAIWQRNIVLNALMIFFMLYFVVVFAAMGYMLQDLFEYLDPKRSPVSVFNGYLFYYLLADLLSRLFLQSLPVLKVAPYLHLPVKRDFLVHNLLFRTLFSTVNLLPLSHLLPFYFRTAIPTQGTWGAAAWLLVILASLSITNLLVSFYKRSAMTNSRMQWLGLAALVALGLSAYLNWIPWLSWSSIVYDWAATGSAFPLLISFGLLGLLYYFNFRYLRHELYPEAYQQTTQKRSILAEGIGQFKSSSKILLFAGMELLLILRNKRPKNVLIISMLFGVYGAVFYIQKSLYSEYSTMFLFAGIFTTGSFLIQYGQFLMCWESAFMDGIHSRPLNIRQYLQSKWLMMAISVGIMFIITLPMGYFGLSVVKINAAAAIFNLGMNTFVMMTAASYNKKRIDLSKGSSFSWQGVGAAQWLVGLPVIGLPVLIYLPFSLFDAPNTGLYVISGIGLLSLLFYKFWLGMIAENITNRKYATLSGFREN